MSGAEGTPVELKGDGIGEKNPNAKQDNELSAFLIIDSHRYP